MQIHREQYLLSENTTLRSDLNNMSSTMEIMDRTQTARLNAATHRV